MTSEGINKFGRIIAILSFAFGTFLFLSSLLFSTSPYTLFFLAILYFIISSALNIGMLGILLINAVASKDHRKNTGMTALLLILNLPIQTIYFLFIFN